MRAKTRSSMSCNCSCSSPVSTESQALSTAFWAPIASLTAARPRAVKRTETSRRSVLDVCLRVDQSGNSFEGREHRRRGLSAHAGEPGQVAGSIGSSPPVGDAARVGA